MQPELAPVDVVIATRGRGALVDTTICSIREGSYDNFTLWVVDQSVDDVTERAVEVHTRADSRIRYMHLSRPGLSIARNTGVAAGSAPLLAFTDDDCRADPDWLAAFVRELTDVGTWAVFGRVLPDETYHPVLPLSDPVSPSLPMAMKDSHQREVFAGNRLNLGFGHGANMGLRRASFEAMGGFDVLLGAGGRFKSWEDRDAGYRILRQGGRIVYVPGALMYHRHWRGWAETRQTYRNHAIGTGAAAGKYVRCGDAGGWYLLLEWILDQGVRQVLSGLVKWRSRQKIQVGLLQIVYPWVGLLQSRHAPVDRDHVIYEPTTA
jgi:GT2 family glycosyltransferase